MSITVSVLGGGCFGTAIANLLAHNKHHVKLWLRDQNVANHISLHKENTRYLPGVQLEDRVKAFTCLEEAVKDADIIFFVLPCSSFEDIAYQATPHIKSGTKLVSCAKGFQPGHFILMSELLRKIVPQGLVSVLSGPNLAKEIVNKAITGTVIASDNPEVCRYVQNVLSSGFFRVYSNQDWYGVELAGALKNIYAIAAGMADALGHGQNTKSVLITRSLAEMSRFAVRLGANPMTFLGLSGVGDLVATCMSPLSRNFRVGYHIAKGESLKSALQQLGHQVAEGVETIKIVRQKSQELNIEMPLVNGLYKVIFEKSSIKRALKELLLGEQTIDVEFLLS